MVFWGWLTNCKGVDQTFSGRFSPIFRGLVWARLIAADTRVKDRDKNPLQKIFFIFLNTFLIKVNYGLCSFCAVAKLLQKGLFFTFSLPSHLRLGDIILHLPFLKFNNKIWYERWMYFSLCKPESRNGALPLYPSIWYYILKSSLEKCRISGQHKKKTAWDSTNQIWGTGIPYVQISENPRPRSWASSLSSRTLKITSFQIEILSNSF